MGLNDDYEDIPGTYVFNGSRCRQGFDLNMFLKTLDKPENREAFRADPAAYLDAHKLSGEQRRAIEKRDWLGMLRIGGNMYYMLKLVAFDGITVQHAGGEMTGMTVEEFRQMMISGGRSIKGNRSKSEWSENG